MEMDYFGEVQPAPPGQILGIQDTLRITLCRTTFSPIPSGLELNHPLTDSTFPLLWVTVFVSHPFHIAHFTIFCEGLPSFLERVPDDCSYTFSEFHAS